MAQLLAINRIVEVLLILIILRWIQLTVRSLILRSSNSWQHLLNGSKLIQRDGRRQSFLRHLFLLHEYALIYISFVAPVDDRRRFGVLVTELKRLLRINITLVLILQKYDICDIVTIEL